MKEITGLCEKYNRIHHPVLLFADKAVLWERNTKREYSVPKEEFDVLYDLVMEKKTDDEIVYNVGELTVDETVQKLLACRVG